jgi:hypothetical protein
VMRVALACPLVALGLASTACDSIFGIGDHGLAADAATDAGTLIFDEEFDGGALDPDKWIVAGNGDWSIAGGVGIQSNPNTTTSMIYAAKFEAATDYHIVARMQSTGPFDEGHNLALAPEVAFRVEPGVDADGIPDSYHCDFNLLLKELILDQTTPTNAPGFATAPANLPADFDEATPFVLDVVVKDGSATCTLTIDGLTSTISTMGDLTRPVGSFGLKTFQTAAKFFYFRVYNDTPD